MLKRVSENFFSLDKAFFGLYTQGALREVPGVRVYTDPVTDQIAGIDLHRTHLPLLEGGQAYLQEHSPFVTRPLVSFPFILRPYQNQAIKFIHNTPNTAIFHELGLGKTAIALAGIRQLPVIILCPTSAIRVWSKELDQVGLSYQVLQGCMGGVSDIDHTKDAYIITYGSAHLWVPCFGTNRVGPHAQCLIIDEAHAVWLKFSRLTQVITSIHVPQILALTATPFRNRLKSIHGILSTLTGKAFGSLSEFRRRYCGAYHNADGYLQDGASTHTDELIARLSSIVSTETWNNPEVQHLRPRLHRHSILADIPIQDRSDALQEAISKAFGAFRSKDGAGLSGAQIAYMTAQRVAIGRMKAEWLAKSSIMQAYSEEHGRVIWWAYHKNSARLLYQALKTYRVPVDYVTGETSSKVREQVLIEWEEGDPETPRNLVCTIGSLNSAVNLVTARASFCIEQSWAPIELQQLEARHHRPGNAHHEVHATYLTALGTIDSRMTQRLLEKLEDHEAVLGDSSQKGQMLALLGREKLEDPLELLGMANDVE